MSTGTALPTSSSGRGAPIRGNRSDASYVVFGKAAGFASNLELSALDGTNGFKINGEAAGDDSGFSVASAGDVNGDGFADLIVGAPGRSLSVFVRDLWEQAWRGSDTKWNGDRERHQRR